MELLQHSFEHDELAGPLRRQARVVLEPLYPPDCVEDALLIISELVQNVIQHTTGGGNLALRHDNDRLVIEVRDGDPAPPQQKPPDQRRTGGRGLLLVAGIACTWGTQPELDGKVVWAEIAVSANPAHTAAATLVRP